MNPNYCVAVDANSLTRFAQACGAVRPLDLMIERPNGTVAKSTSVPMPFAIIGSDPYCELALPGSELAPRHLIMQIVMGRVFVVDISGKPNGLLINGIPRPDGWIMEGEPVVLAGHRLMLTAPVAPTVAEPVRNFHPLVPNPDVVIRFAKSQIEFRNGRTAQNRWEVNRVMTFVGRAKACKINLTSEDISLFHCYFLLTIDGLWAVDAFGRGGIAVNGIPNRFFRLRESDELTIARFHLGVAYPEGDPGEPIIPLAAATPVSQFDSHFIQSAEPQVRSGDTPAPTQPSTPIPGMADGTPSPCVEMPKDLVVPGAAAPGSDPSNGTAITGQMFEQFQNSMLMMMKMFGQMHQQQMTGLQQEMARLASLTDEIGKMQTEIQKAVVPVAPEPHHNPLPAPDEVPSVNEKTADQHQLIFDKMAKLEAERQTIWKRLANAFAPKPMSV